jgi:class 3 adenylate cyclase/tetratricopeptide (TPR) repeat protein
VAEERKFVSVLFVDIVDSTAHAERTDPEDVRERLQLFFETFRGWVERFGGVVEKFIGDAAVAVFGAPLAHGDDAERAVRCGIAVLDDIASLDPDGPAAGMRVRGAVNTGEAVVSLGSDHERGEALATGDVVNTAARLQSAAPPGGLVVGEETYRATRRAIRYEELPAVDAKGKSEPVAAWLVLGVGTAPARPTSGFVGRDRELDVLTSTWQRVVDERRPHLITILGPPGIGKSRLGKEFIAKVEAGGARTVRGRSLPYEEQTGYRASAEQVRNVAGILVSDTPAVARTKLMEALPRLVTEPEVEEIGRYLSLLLGLGTDDRSEGETPLFFAVRRVVEGLGADGPTVLVFEDVHWADTSQLELLEYLRTHIRDVPVAFLALARPELLDTRPTWGAGLLSHTTIPLEPLSAEDAAAVATATLSDALEGSATVRQLIEVAEGNPLFIEELAASVAEGAFGSANLPSTVREAIASRIDILPTDQRTVLLDASVIGRMFWRGALAAIGDEQRLDPILDALEARDLIRREPTSRVEADREFAFKHILIREVAYGTLPRAARRERHAAVAKYLEQQVGDKPDLAWFLAHQWREAGEHAKAVEYLIVAAERAQQAFAKDEAIALFDEAIELSPEPADRNRVRLLRAFALSDLADFEAAANELDELIPELEGEDEIDALIGRTRAAIWTERFDVAMTSAERARDLAERAGDAVRTAPAIGFVCGVQTMTGKTDEAIAHGEEALRRWVPGTRGSDFATLKEFLSDCYYWVGRYAEAEEFARAAHELGGTTHNVNALMRGGGWRGVALAGMGRTEDSMSLLELLIETAELIGRPRFAAPALNYSTQNFRDLYLLDEARTRNERALEVVGREGEYGMPGMQGRIDLLITDLMQGDVGRAQREWPALWDEAINGSAWRPWLGGCRLAYVHAMVAQRSEGPEATAEAATDALERAERIRRRKYVAMSRAILGEALVAAGRRDEGLTELEAAVAGADALGTPSIRWQHRVVLGKARYATGDDDGAGAAYGEAADVIRSYAGTLSPEHATSFLDADPVRDALKTAGS